MQCHKVVMDLTAHNITRCVNAFCCTVYFALTILLLAVFVKCDINKILMFCNVPSSHKLQEFNNKQ